MVSAIPAEDGKIDNLFYSVASVQCRPWRISDGACPSEAHTDNLRKIEFKLLQKILADSKYQDDFNNKLLKTERTVSQEGFGFW